MENYDDRVVQCFLREQGKLFPEPVAETPEEAREFLEDCFAQVVRGKKQVMQYFDEVGADVEGDVLDAAEVFAIGDARFLIVEG